MNKPGTFNWERIPWRTTINRAAKKLLTAAYDEEQGGSIERIWVAYTVILFR
jgi:hypothetical protein